jgi:hypothetical protein
VYVRVTPRTKSLSEGRQVLRELERFGPVEMFRSLKVRHACFSIPPPSKSFSPPKEDGSKRIYSALTATWEEEEAEGGPWKATEGEEPPTSETDAQGRFPQRTNPTLPYRSPWGTSSPAPIPPSHDTPTFTLVASLSNLDHAAYISRQPFYGPYRPLADPVQSSRIWRRGRWGGRGGGRPGLGEAWREGMKEEEGREKRSMEDGDKGDGREEGRGDGG